MSVRRVGRGVRFALVGGALATLPLEWGTCGNHMLTGFDAVREQPGAAAFIVVALVVSAALGLFASRVPLWGATQLHLLAFALSGNAFLRFRMELDTLSDLTWAAVATQLLIALVVIDAGVRAARGVGDVVAALPPAAADLHADLRRTLLASLGILALGLAITGVTSAHALFLPVYAAPAIAALLSGWLLAEAARRGHLAEQPARLLAAATLVAGMAWGIDVTGPVLHLTLPGLAFMAAAGGGFVVEPIRGAMFSRKPA